MVEKRRDKSGRYVSSIPPEIRKEILNSPLESPSQVARKLGLPYSTVEHIRHRAGITTAKREKPIPVVSEERRPVSPAPKQSVQNTWRSVAELSQEERQAIVLEEGKAKDIAARYGVAPRSVYGLRERARKKGVPTVPTRQVGLAVASPEMRKRVSEMARDPNHRNPKRSSAYRLAQEHGGDLRLRKGYNRRERKPK